MGTFSLWTAEIEARRRLREGGAITSEGARRRRLGGGVGDRRSLHGDDQGRARGSMNSSSRLQIDGLFAAFVENELLPGTGLDAAAWRHALEALLAEFTPRNAALLERRDELQALIDAWWRDRRGRDVSVEDQTAFLRDIGYLLPEPGDFIIGTAGVDPEIGAVAGPQLVVPVSNERYALNAANARWGSLYDALYGTDALEPPTGGKGYDPARGATVIAYGRSLLDRVAPLAKGSHADAQS